MRKIIQLGKSQLEKKSEEVRDPKDPKIQKLVKELIILCKEEDKNGGGLAAPQLGENVRVFVARRLDLEEKAQKSKDKKDMKEEAIWEIFINPKITSKGKKKSTFWEGCLSVENGKLFGPVSRPSFIKVEYLDRYGNKKKLTATDYFAHIIQHEQDHLNGILFVKYVKNPENLWHSNDLDKYIDEVGDFPDIK